MDKRRKILGTIIAAYAEPAAGPGWANSPLWLIVRDENQKLRRECLQPEEQTADILNLYSVSAAAHAAITSAARRALGKSSAPDVGAPR